MRRFSEASAITAPPVQAFDGEFQTMVVSEASTSPVAFSRTVPSPPKQRTNKRPPPAPFTSPWVGANSLAWVQSITKAKPFCASHSRPREVGAMPCSPLKDGPTSVTHPPAAVADLGGLDVSRGELVVTEGRRARAPTGVTIPHHSIAHV